VKKLLQNRDTEEWASIKPLPNRITLSF
jgi:hypothetical protein